MSAEGESSTGFAALPRPVKTYHTTTYPDIKPGSNGFDGRGKTVVITGGATGIGESISDSFAAAGVARLIIIARSIEPLQKLQTRLTSTYPNLEVIIHSASVTDHARMTSILTSLPEINVLVLSAASGHPFLPPTELTVTHLHDVLETNVVSTFSTLPTFNPNNLTSKLNPLPDLTHLYLAHPTASKTLISISSAAVQTHVPGMAAYSASKAASAILLQHFARAQSDTKIISVHPGAHYTPLARSAGVGEGDFAWDDVALPGEFVTWVAGEQARGLLHGRFVWAHWDVRELVEVVERKVREGDEGFLTIGLVQ